MPEHESETAAGPPPPPVEPVEPVEPHAEPPRVLRRSRDDRVIAGLAGGLGRYLGVDPVLLRIAFVVLIFAGGSGLLLYLIGWIVMPEEAEGDRLGPAPASRMPAAGMEAVGLVLLVVGAFLLVRVLLPDVFSGRYVWPVALIILGLALLLRGARR